MTLDKNQQAFLALVEAGLWEKDVRLSDYGIIDFMEIYRLAEEQSVLGVVTAGIEHVTDIKIPQADALAFVGSTLQIEQRNSSMNSFIAGLLPKTMEAGFQWVLVKGQGIAQCYLRPNWRNAGDIDLLVDDRNYNNAREYFDNLTGQSNIDDRNNSRKHLEYNIGSWLVELHGTMHTNLSPKIDRTIDEIQDKVFNDKEVRLWKDSDIIVSLPSLDNDVIFVFTHILQHFFKGGIGLRQLCDLSRLLWTYHDSINKSLLKQRLEEMGIMTEWKTFGYILVETLGLQKNSMPFYDGSFRSRANRVLALIMESGNFGHNYDYSYFSKYPTILRKIITVWKQTRASFRQSVIFPIDSFKFYVSFLVNKTKSTVSGE